MARHPLNPCYYYASRARHGSQTLDLVGTFRGNVTSSLAVTYR